MEKAHLRQSLDLDAARAAVQKTADELGLSLFEAAEGIIRIANETMLGCLRLVSIEQGYDPRDFSLVAFGGAGPLHANALGTLLHTFPVIVPQSPGVLCAWGDATTRLRHEETKTFIRNLSTVGPQDIVAAYEELLAKAQTIMLEEQGVAHELQVYRYQADLRYLGQAITIPVDIDWAQLQLDAATHLAALFEGAHKQAFTFTLSSDIELMNLRIIVEESPPKFTLRRLDRAKASEPPQTAISSFTTLIFNNMKYEKSPIWVRSELKWGHTVAGPCIVTEMDSNTLVHPGHHAEVDELGNILIRPSMESPRDGLVPAELDTVMIDIFESALRNARNEMDTRTSVVDEFNVIAEPGGKMLVGQFGSFLAQFLERWKGTIEGRPLICLWRGLLFDAEDDIFLTNDPYSVGGSISHLNDWLVVMPVFAHSKLIAWTSNFGHMTDTGGAVPGSLPTGATSIFEEGIQIPIMKVCSRGIWNDQLMELIYRNVRLPDWNRCDTAALVASCKLAGQRMQQLYARFGDKNYFAIIDELLERNRKAIGTLIKDVIPDAPVYFEDWIDDDGRGTGSVRPKGKGLWGIRPL
uniref:5-oxoprolinase n=1 Tax=Mycena chlorophos TaxID=658473 RepID=A0ABQ0MF17_MYCCL|nr:5-oxoprolinase [Mycena chlorophos]